VLSTVFVIARGVHRGLEMTMYFMLPAFVILIVALIFYAVNTGSFMEGFIFIFKPDFTKLTGEGVLIALGQAFFTLSIATGGMLAYGAYVSKDTNIGRTVFIICIADTIVAIVAGLMVFPIVFANGLQPDAGASLIFKTLPLAFGHMPFGSLFAAIFFLMLFFAAFTSAVALMEPATMYLMDAMKWSRIRAATTAGFTIWVVTFGSIASLNFAPSMALFNMPFFDLLDYVTANIMIPVGAFLLCLFTGWRMTRKDTADELQLQSTGLSYQSWRFVMRFMAPVLIIIIFLSALGFI
jgi:NSS family neurotransmitter:Na+ symporter